jgi:hypothetical protein
MAQVNGVAIADRGSAHPSGALFLLAHPAKASIIIQPETGTEVELRSGSAFLVARCGDSGSAEHAFDKAHETAQRALDIISAAGQRPMQIVDAHTEVLLWWREGSRQILRVISVMPTGIEISMSVTVMGADGQIVPSAPQPQPTWHASLRYFRLSQLTDDLTEAFRNAYLAFESILSLRYPRLTFPSRRPGGRLVHEAEGVWLERALRAVDSSNPLNQAYVSRTGDCVTDFIQDVYTDVRCRLFHAKSGSSVILPHSIIDRRSVRAACANLMRVTQMLITSWLSGRRGGGVLTHYGFKMAYGAVLSDALLTVEGEPRSRGISSVAIPMRIATALNAPGLLTAIGCFANPRRLPALRRARVSKAANVLLEYEFPGLLEPNRLDELQFQTGFQLRNSGEPKSIFRS